MANILTALQPSGVLHIGNYFGAIEPFVKLQDDGNTNFLFIVDYHAITVPQDPKQLRQNILFAAATYLAAGVDPNKTLLFQQSRVSAHTELAWILNCLTHMGELERMTQFKDKTRNKGESVTVGLFDYPVLMAADILLYDTNIVPVGEDQKQHVELARDIAERFNNRFGETFVIPKPHIRKEGARVMALDDPTSKMSKSAASDKNFLSLMDDEKTVEKKIKAAMTDAEGTIVNRPGRLGVSNLMTIYELVSGKTMAQIEAAFEGKGYAQFKQDLIEQINQFLQPLQQRIHDSLKDHKNLIEILEAGAQKAQAIAEKKMQQVREAIGVKLS
ncbi:tryptophan--tRNA ligase [Candidatus Uhrbacteria bacterium]|nr:tryptophan--tRNA ligase [Candidatus Uhrbacteria bacterium]